MLNECDNFLHFPLTVYFLNESRRQEFLAASYSKEHDCCDSTRPTIFVDSLEEMPFWVKRSKRKGTGMTSGKESKSSIPSATTMDTDAMESVERDKRLRCYTCNFTAADDETTIICQQCSSMFHEFCLEGLSLRHDSSIRNGESQDTKWYVASRLRESFLEDVFINKVAHDFGFFFHAVPVVMQN